MALRKEHSEANPGTARCERRRTHANANLVYSYPDGSPQLAAHINNNSDLLILRRFAYLHVRVLQDLQIEVGRLGDKVHDLEVEDSRKNPKALKSRDVDKGRVVGESCQNLLQKVWEKLVLYRKLLLV